MPAKCLLIYILKSQYKMKEEQKIVFEKNSSNREMYLFSCTYYFQKQPPEILFRMIQGLCNRF